MFKITEEDYEECVADLSGYCYECEAIVGEDIKPDEYGHECPECGSGSLVGMEHALVYEYLEISEEDNEEFTDNVISFSED